MYQIKIQIDFFAGSSTIQPHLNPNQPRSLLNITKNLDKAHYNQDRIWLSKYKSYT